MKTDFALIILAFCAGLIIGIILPEQPFNAYQRGYCQALNSEVRGEQCVIRHTTDSITAQKIHSYR